MTTPPFQGMRWFKCDLHMHTPEDSRHWNDPLLRISSPRDEQNLQEKARSFLERCHDLGLECIAVVDHNFSAETKHRLWFLTHLIEQNNTVADSRSCSPIVIFPGFELDIRYHVLCLFNPVRKGAQLQNLSDILTNMGLPSSGRFSSGTPQQPKHHGQCWSLREVLDKVQNELGGIVIAAHAFSNDGICNDTANIDDFVENWDLYAVEVHDWPLSGKPKTILEGTDNNWKRRQPHNQPAALRSSDCKALGDASLANNIGYRFSWIKMSKPSIEALRQAFLDPESRICLEDEPPPVVHTYIKKSHISGSKFLQDQTVEFSPYLNCIIGGRGSGKSLLFESLRLGLHGELHLENADKNHVAVKQLNRLRGTFTSNTEIQLNVIHGGLEDRFVVDNSGQPARVENREVDDPPTVFRGLSPLIFSQEEITQLADRQKSLLDFIDSLALDQLEPHRIKAREIIDQLKTARQIDEKIQRLESEFTTLKQEISELARQLEAKTQVQEELKNHRAAQEAQRYLNSITTKADETIERLEELTKELESEPPPLDDQAKRFSESTFLIQLEKKINVAYRNLDKALESVITDFQNEINLALEETVIEKVRVAIKQAENTFKKACDKKDLTPEEAVQLRETEAKYHDKQDDLKNKQVELAKVRKQMPDMKRLFKRLTICWARETKTRRGVLDDIVSSPTIPRTNNGESIIKAFVIFAGDRETFLKAWEELAPDRRTAVGRAWDSYARDGKEGNIGDQLFDAFQKSIHKGGCYGNPLHWLEANWNNPNELPRLVQEYLDDIKKVKQEKPEKWFEIMITRIADAADLTLLRNDGTVAGSFQKEDLSTGQKNTAILSLLLARGNGPVLIDQPEDELDSEFLFKELVPMVRKTKIHRQMIIVTHNANIPVNADAELVYALQAKGGRGVCRAQGGLDRPEITQAVLDIMEGSEEAFRRRKEKYHF